MKGHFHFVSPRGDDANPDYLGKKRNADNPFPGPFELSAGGPRTIKVWPIGESRSRKA